MDGLSNPSLSSAEWRRRMARSFASLEGWEEAGIGVRVEGGRVFLDVNIEKADGN